MGQFQELLRKVLVFKSNVNPEKRSNTESGKSRYSNELLNDDEAPKWF